MESRSSKDAITPSAPYSYRPPSGPFIHVPVVQRNQAVFNRPLDLSPSYDHLDPAELTSQDLSIITRNIVQRATDRAATWSYEQRREAQSILDFLYLGPTSVIRDHGFLIQEGITMIMVVRDARLAHQNLASLDKAVADLNIAASYLDITSSHQLVHLFPGAIRQINRHLLDVYHSKAHQAGEDDMVLTDGEEEEEEKTGNGNIRFGKVLVVCDTGSDRSAAVVAAYIMSMFDKDMVTTLQFIGLQRFCCGFDEDLKRALLTWEDIVRAQSAVAMNARSHAAVSSSYLSAPSGDLSNAFTSLNGSSSRPVNVRLESKRRLDDLMDETEDGVPAGERDERSLDRERFEGRDAFVPFVDRSEA